MGDYIKCELVGGGYPKYLDIFLTCLYLLYTTHTLIYATYCFYC